MTVSTTSYLIQYAGTGSTTDFATGFEFIADTDLVVVLTDAAGVDTTQVITTNYTVAGAGVDAGGTVTMLTPPAVGETLTIYRNTSRTQGTDYTEFDPFPADSHEQALDKLTLISQETAGRQDRSIQFRESEDRSGGTKNSYIPSPDTGKFLGWDANGNLINQELAAVTYDLTVSGGDAGKVVVVNGTEDGIEVGALPVSSAATASTIASRDASGRIKVADPSAAQDAASKNYVDNVQELLVDEDLSAGTYQNATIFSANSGYRYFAISIEEMTGSASLASAAIRVSVDGSTFEGGANDYKTAGYATFSSATTGTSGPVASELGTLMSICIGTAWDNRACTAFIKVVNPHSTTQPCVFKGEASLHVVDGSSPDQLDNFNWSQAYTTANSAVTGFELRPQTTGTFTGKLRVWGSNKPF